MPALKLGPIVMDNLLWYLYEMQQPQASHKNALWHILYLLTVLDTTLDH